MGGMYVGDLRDVGIALRVPELLVLLFCASNISKIKLDVRRNILNRITKHLVTLRRVKFNLFTSSSSSFSSSLSWEAPIFWLPKDQL